MFVAESAMRLAAELSGSASAGMRIAAKSRMRCNGTRRSPGEAVVLCADLLMTENWLKPEDEMALMSMQGSGGRKSFPSAWLLIAIASAVLMGCSKEKQPEVSAQNGSSAAAAANLVMPPAVVASHTYRCKDNSIVTADFFADETTLLLREGSASSPTKLTSAAKGMPFIGDSESVTVQGVSLTIEERDRPTRVCNRD